MKATGGGHLYLAVNEYTRQRMNERIMSNMRPLLEHQDYVAGVELHYGQTCKFDLDTWRYVPGHLYCCFRNLAERHLAEFGIGPEYLKKPWLKAGKNRVKPVIIHRSARYRNPHFPWRRIVETYRDNIGFVGAKDEHAEFCRKNGKVEYISTKDFLDLAEVINGARLYIGNQSAPYAIAEGLKKQTIQEVWQQAPDCIFPRKNAQFVIGSEVELPKI